MPDLPTGVVAILFTDAVQSTAKLHVIGEERAHELRSAEFSLLQGVVDGTGGASVKTVGDGLMAVFQSPIQAVECAIQMQEAIQANNAAAPQHERLELRVGLHAGEAVAEGGDYFGSPVVFASRLCDAAAGGQIIASQIMHGLLGARADHRFRALGQLDFAGFPEPMSAYEVLWETRASTVREITVLLPNRPGALHGLTSLLEKNAVDIRAYHVASAGQTGFVQLVCSPHDLAMEILSDQYRHYLLETEVIAVIIEDGVGALRALLSVLAELSFNVNQAYLARGPDGQPVAIVDLDDQVQREVATRALMRAGYQLLPSFEG